MDLDLAMPMSSLMISHKKRRLSGLIKGPLPGNDSPTYSPTTMEDYESSSLLSSSVSMPSLSFTQTSESHKTEEEAPRRSSRRSTIPSQPTPEASASCSSLSYIDDTDEKTLKALKKIYMNKKVKKTAQTLETIFEQPDEDKLMSSRKFKRLISFKDLQKNKVKKLSFKAKKAAAQYIKTNKKNKISMNAFMEKLNELDSD